MVRVSFNQIKQGFSSSKPVQGLSRSLSRIGSIKVNQSSRVNSNQQFRKRAISNPSEFRRLDSAEEFGGNWGIKNDAPFVTFDKLVNSQGFLRHDMRTGTI